MEREEREKVRERCVGVERGTDYIARKCLVYTNHILTIQALS